MTRHVVRLTLRKPTVLTRLGYRMAGLREPYMDTARPLSHELARLVPYRFRAFHKRFALRHGFFWLLCPLCDRAFGGHELAGSVPDPMHGENRYFSVCGPCASARQRAGVSS